MYWKLIAHITWKGVKYLLIFRILVELWKTMRCLILCQFLHNQFVSCDLEGLYPVGLYFRQASDRCFNCAVITFAQTRRMSCYFILSRNRLDRQDWRCGGRYRIPSITGPSSLISIKSATSLIHPSTYRNRELLDRSGTLFYSIYKSTLNHIRRYWKKCFRKRPILIWKFSDV